MSTPCVGELGSNGNNELIIMSCFIKKNVYCLNYKSSKYEYYCLSSACKKRRRYLHCTYIFPSVSHFIILRMNNQEFRKPQCDSL